MLLAGVETERWQSQKCRIQSGGDATLKIGAAPLALLYSTFFASVLQKQISFASEKDIVPTVDI